MNQSTTFKIAHDAYKKSKEIYTDSLVSCYLYGSYARGDYDNESDVNVLLIIDVENNTIHDKDKELAHISNQLSLKYGITVTIKITSRQLFDSFVFDDIRAEGVVIN